MIAPAYPLICLDFSKVNFQKRRYLLDPDAREIPRRFAKLGERHHSPSYVDLALVRVGGPPSSCLAQRSPSMAGKSQKGLDCP